MAHSQRGWTGARTPSAIKRVRQTARRHAIQQPRRSAAKTLISKAMATSSKGDAEQTRESLTAAISALDLAAKAGAIHANAAARRKSRLTLKVNAMLGGSEVVSTAKTARTTGKAAATKEAKARIAAGKATKAKGAQTAAGKARAALARSSREATADTTAKAEPATTTKAPAKPAAKSTATKTAAKSTTTKATTTKTTAKASTSKTTAKASTAKPRASTKKSS